MSEQRETPPEREEREEVDEEEPQPNVGTDPMDPPEQGKKKPQVAPEGKKTKGKDTPGDDT